MDKTSPEMAAHDTPTTFTTRVNLVTIPVVVRDAKGKAIGTYTKEDFQLFDKGKPQTITRFSIEKASSRAAKGKIVSAEPPGENAPPADMATRFTAYVFDDLHIEVGDLMAVKSAAAKHLTENLDPSTRMAIYTTSGQTMLDFTDDKEKLLDTLNRIQRRSRTGAMLNQCPDIHYYMADLMVNKRDAQAIQVAVQETIACMGMDPKNPQDVLNAGQTAQQTASQVLVTGEMETRLALGVLKDIVRHMAASPGQRTMVFVSPGIFIPDNERTDEAEIFDRAIHANVTISSLDARGLYTLISGGDASQRGGGGIESAMKGMMDHVEAGVQGEMLGELADATGGVYFHNNNDLHEGFRLTAATPEYVYMLGFSPQNLKFDGGYHALKVTLKPLKGLGIQARRGYYAPKHQVNEAEQAKQEIAEALFSREEIQDIPVGLQTQFFKPTDITAKLSVLARVDLKPLHFRKGEGRNNNTLTVVSGVFDRNGNLISGLTKTIEMRLKDETLEARLAAGITVKTSFDVTPGNYVVRLVVRDAEGHMMSARNGVVQIP